MRANQFWRVYVQWDDVDMDGRSYGRNSVCYRFPGKYSRVDALEAASDRWDGMDWTPSEHARAVRTYSAKAVLMREHDGGELVLS